MENKLAKNIKKLRIEKGLSQEELGKQIDASKQAISGWEIGNRDPNKSQRQKLCEFFSITEGELFGQIISSNPKTIDIPLIGEVPAGKFNFAFEEVVDHITVNYDFVNRKNCFALKVKGNCLKDAGIMNGDIVIVAPDVHINNGDFVVARVEDECTMKKFYKTKSKDGKHDQIILQPCNHDYEPIILNPKSTKVEIVGKVIRALKIL